MNNPWLDMPVSSKRRVDYNISSNIFWIKNEKENFGLYIDNEEKIEKEINFQLKGIDIYKIGDETRTGFIFILKNLKDWEIFLVLCKDLIAAASLKNNSGEVIDEIFKRLNQWKQILSENIVRTFPLQLEMGLLGELFCLTEKIIPLYGVNEAVRNWTGPDFEKQDFILDDKIIEVKTYMPSKGKSVRISSAEQLFFNKNIPLYLNALALQKSDSGITIENLIEDVLENTDLTIENAKLFELKLINYGYFKELYKDTINSFKIYDNEVYFIEEDFPRIKSEEIPTGISNISYDIDLWKCQNFFAVIE